MLEMHERQVVRGFLLPPRQETPGAVRPRMQSFHYPPSRPGRSSTATVGRFTDPGDVHGVAVGQRDLADRERVVALVRTQMLSMPASRPGTPDLPRAQCFADELLVMHIGAADGHRQRHAPAIGERRPFHSQLAAIRGVLPGFFPRPEELWSSLHPCSASATGCLSVRHTHSAPAARTSRTLRLAPIPGSTHGWRCRSRTPAAWLSTDSRCGRRRRCR